MSLVSNNTKKHSIGDLTIEHGLYSIIILMKIRNKEAWPSGKAGACKALIPSSNLGASFFLNKCTDKARETAGILWVEFLELDILNQLMRSQCWQKLSRLNHLLRN